MKDTRYNIYLFKRRHSQLNVRKKESSYFCAYQQNGQFGGDKLVKSNCLLGIAAFVAVEVFDRTQGQDEARTFRINYSIPPYLDEKARDISRMECNRLSSLLEEAQRARTVKVLDANSLI